MSSTTEILRVGTNKTLKKAFIDVPWAIYNSDDFPQWVPPLKASVEQSLDIKNNPFYQQAEIELFLAKRDGKYVGRIAAIENHAHNKFHQEKIGFYGFFECIEDQEVANRLFESVEQWCRQRDLTAMRGPASPSLNHECGLLVRGQSQHPTIMTTWNPKYYESLHENARMRGVKDLVAYWIPQQGIEKLPEKTVTVAEKLRNEDGFTMRDIDLKNWDKEVESCFEIYNSAWEKNWGFVPMTKDEFIYMAKDMKMIIDKRFSFIVEKNGVAAGFSFALPDINWILKRNPSGRLFPLGLAKLLIGKRFLKTVRIVALGVRPEFRKEGIFALFTHESFVRSKTHGLIGGEASWILEDNEAMNRPWKSMGLPIYRRWRIYECSFAQAR